MPVFEKNDYNSIIVRYGDNNKKLAKNLRKLINLKKKCLSFEKQLSSKKLSKIKSYLKQCYKKFSFLTSGAKIVFNYL